MTVDEAKKKWCPILNKAQTCPCFCAADMCMAWRWHEEFVTDHLCETFLNEDSRLEYKPRPVLSKTSGYCGLAGKEETE